MDTLKLSANLSYPNTKVYVNIQQPTLENIIIERAELPSERINSLLEIIKEPTYYKFHEESYYSDTTLISLTIIHNDDSNKLHYEYSISNKGIIHIKDLYNQKVDSFYSLKPFYKLFYPLFTTSKNAEIELYNQIYTLIYP